MTVVVDNVRYILYDDATAQVTFKDSTILDLGVYTLLQYNYYSKYIGDIVIPSKITYGNQDFIVKSINHHAFNGCSGLTSVTIPQSITQVGEGAFCGCKGLTFVNIPQSITKVGKSAFASCSGLTSITIPNSLTSIEDNVFDGCNSLASITIPNTVKTIGSKAFKGCGLTSITIPNSVTSIGDDAFCDCGGMEKVYIEYIESWCGIDFGNYKSNPLFYAKHLYLLPINHMVIGGSEVKDLAIPNTVKSINHYAFSGCSGLTSVSIPNSVTSIGSWAFYGCI